jgi:hypothetical protein
MACVRVVQVAGTNKGQTARAVKTAGLVCPSFYESKKESAQNTLSFAVPLYRISGGKA